MTKQNETLCVYFCQQQQQQQYAVFQQISLPSCLCYKLFFPKPILMIFGRNIARDFATSNGYLLNAIVSSRVRAEVLLRQQTTGLVWDAAVGHR